MHNPVAVLKVSTNSYICLTGSSPGMCMYTYSSTTSCAEERGELLRPAKQTGWLLTCTVCPSYEGSCNMWLSHYCGGVDLAGSSVL